MYGAHGGPDAAQNAASEGVAHRRNAGSSANISAARSIARSSKSGTPLEQDRIALLAIQPELDDFELPPRSSSASSNASSHGKSPAGATVRRPRQRSSPRGSASCRPASIAHMRSRARALRSRGSGWRLQQAGRAARAGRALSPPSRTKAARSSPSSGHEGLLALIDRSFSSRSSFLRVAFWKTSRSSASSNPSSSRAAARRSSGVVSASASCS